MNKRLLRGDKESGGKRRGKYEGNLGRMLTSGFLGVDEWMASVIKVTFPCLNTSVDWLIQNENSVV